MILINLKCVVISFAHEYKYPKIDKSNSKYFSIHVEYQEYPMEFNYPILN